MYAIQRAIKIFAVIVIVIAILAFIAVDTELIYIDNVDIAVLLKHQRPELAVAGPAYIEGENSELCLNEEYLALTASESTDLTGDEKLAVINRWTNEIYPYFHAFLLASLIDPAVYRIAGGLQEADDAGNGIAARITEWSKSNLIHTQALQAFREQPGNDPWGLVNLVYPAYKKLLPSGMIAESVYSGKISGKCESLAAFNAGLFAVAGCDPANVLLLRKKGHVLGLVRLREGLYLIDNKKIELVTEENEYYLKQIRFLWYFTYDAAVKVKFRLNDAFFEHPGTLRQAIAEVTGTGADFAGVVQGLAGVDLRDRDAVYQSVFSAAEDAELNRHLTLTRYAYQSLYVREPERYLEASVRAPVTKALAKELHSAEEVFGWIRSHIRCAPIFEDYRDRIMIADEVIVFGKGTCKDQGMLAAALLYHLGMDPTLLLTANTAYVSVENQIYDVKTWETVDKTAEPAILEISME